MEEDRTAELPASGAVVDLIPASRSAAYLSWAVASAGKDLLVLVPVDQERRSVNLPVGERIELVWRDPAGLLALPVVLEAVLPGERPCWRLRAAGVVKRGQRRDAVRAPMTVPVRLGPEASAVTGTTVDISEGGLRCILETSLIRGVAPDGPDVGSIVHVLVSLPERTVDCRAEVSRRHPRDDGRVELSLRFVGLSEHEQDEIRRQVFNRLRELRQRGVL